MQKNFSKGFSKIDKIISHTAKEYNLEAAFNKQQAIKHWQAVVVGFVEEARELSQAIDFKNGILKVACLTREVAEKLKVLSQRIIYALNKAIGKTLVYAIYTEV